MVYPPEVPSYREALQCSQITEYIRMTVACSGCILGPLALRLEVIFGDIACHRDVVIVAGNHC